MSILDKICNRCYTEDAQGKEVPTGPCGNYPQEPRKEEGIMLERIVAFLSEIELLPLE